MSSTTVTWNGDEFIASLQKARINGLDMVGDTVAKSVRRSLNQKNSSRTAKRTAKKKGGDMSQIGSSAAGEPPARMTGELWRSIEHALVEGKNSVIVGVRSDSPANTYALIHEFGGFIQARSGTRFEMPARPYLRPALARELDNLNSIFAREVGRTLKQEGWLK